MLVLWCVSTFTLFCSASLTPPNRKDKFVFLFAPQLLHTLHYQGFLLEWLHRHWIGFNPKPHRASSPLHDWIGQALSRPNQYHIPASVKWFTPHADACQTEWWPEFIDWTITEAVIKVLVGFWFIGINLRGWLVPKVAALVHKSFCFVFFLEIHWWFSCARIRKQKTISWKVYCICIILSAC